MIAPTADPADEADSLIDIELADVEATDAFGLAIEIDGAPPTVVRARAPGLFRANRRKGDPPLARAGDRVTRGHLLGFVGVGPLLTPVTTPHDGWVLAVGARSGAPVGYGDALFLILTNSSADP